LLADVSMPPMRPVSLLFEHGIYDGKYLRDWLGEQLEKLDAYTQDMLFCSGRDAALKFLDGAPGHPAWDWEAYKRKHRSAPSPAA